MQVLFLIVMMPIVIADFRHHVIPNIYLKYLSLFLGFSWIVHGMPHPTYVASSLIFVCLLAMAKFGMGDVKLLSILLLTLQPKIDIFAAFLALFSVTHIVISTARKRVIPVSIPLAPAIFSAFITYLATQ